MIKFGYSRDTNFKERMRKYDRGDEDKFEPAISLDDTVLLSTAEEFILESGDKVTLTANDIRKCEVMCISQFWFLDYRDFSHLLINNGGGGDISSSKKERESVERELEDAKIYFRIGRERMKLADFERQKVEPREVNEEYNDTVLNLDAKIDRGDILNKENIFERLKWQMKKKILKSEKSELTI
jgi:hypothetical protein